MQNGLPVKNFKTITQRDVDINQRLGIIEVMARKTTVSEILRKTIRNSGESQRGICRATGLDPAALCRFMSGQTGLTTTSVDKLAAYFGLELVKKRRTRRKKG